MLVARGVIARSQVVAHPRTSNNGRSLTPLTRQPESLLYHAMGRKSCNS